MITFISIVVLIGSAFLHCSFGESLVLAILTWVVLFILKKVIKSIHEKNVTKKKAKMAMRGE